MGTCLAELPSDRGILQIIRADRHTQASHKLSVETFAIDEGLMKRKGHDTLYIALLMAAAICAVAAWSTHHDFLSFYAAAQLLRWHPHSLYSLTLQWNAQKTLGMPDFLPWVHPAPEALLFAPLTFLPLSKAFAVWTLISICLLITSAWLFRDEISNMPPSRHFALMAFSCIPICSDLWLGQDAALILVLWVLAWRKLKEGADYTAGLLIGLGLIRYQFALPMLVFFLVLRKWRLLVGVLTTGDSGYMWLGGYSRLPERSTVSRTNQ